ncbi:MAG: TIM barrel protein [Pseudomonadota bacterium]
MSQTQPLLSLAAGILPEYRGPAVAAAAAEAGYRAFGVTGDQDWQDAETAQVRALQRAHGMAWLDVEVVWLQAGARVTDLHRRIIDVGAELGARQVLMVSAEPDPQAVAEAQHALCELAAPAGMGVVLEFLRITAITRPSQALAIARAAAHPGAGVLVDALHLARSGEDVATLAGAADLLPYLQLCDGPRTCEEDAEALLEDALDRRSAAGEGQLPLRALMAQVPGVPLSLEVRSRRYREAYPEAAARAGAVLAQTRRWLAQAPAADGTHGALS